MAAPAIALPLVSLMTPKYGTPSSEFAAPQLAESSSKKSPPLASAGPAELTQSAAPRIANPKLRIVTLTIRATHPLALVRRRVRELPRAAGPPRTEVANPE